MPDTVRKIIVIILMVGSLDLKYTCAQSPHEPTPLRILDSGKVFHDPPFHSCHAATIAEVANDTLLYAWFGGDQEGADNVCIWACFRYTQQKQQWGQPFLMACGRDSIGHPAACWNPVLFKTKEGSLFLDYKTGSNPRSWRAMRKTSHDHGRTWTEPIPLTAGFLGPIRNKPIQLKNGDILYGSSVEDTAHWAIHAEISSADGKDWRYIAIDNDTFDVIQPTILSYPDGSIQMLCRSKQNRIVETRSADQGMTWTKVKATSLPNPNSGIDAVSQKDGRKLLVYNPLPAGRNWWNGRNTLLLAVSADGNTWKDALTLENKSSGEYSYPAIIVDSRGIVRIAYTFERRFIKFVDVE